MILAFLVSTCLIKSLKVRVPRSYAPLHFLSFTCPQNISLWFTIWTVCLYSTRFMQQKWRKRKHFQIFKGAFWIKKFFLLNILEIHASFHSRKISYVVKKRSNSFFDSYNFDWVIYIYYVSLEDYSLLPKVTTK
jgi:hypothetical protein